MRTDPRPASMDVEPNYLPLIEFDPPDLPWLFTPAQAARTTSCGRGACSSSSTWQSSRRRARRPGQPLPVLDVPERRWWRRSCRTWPSRGRGRTPRWSRRRPGGPRARSWPTKPAMNVSRLMAPRRLEPGKRYAACLVPAFDAGVARGLGGEPDAADGRWVRRGRLDRRRRAPARLLLVGVRDRPGRATSRSWPGGSSRSPLPETGASSACTSAQPVPSCPRCRRRSRGIPRHGWCAARAAAHSGTLADVPAAVQAALRRHARRRRRPGDVGPTRHDARCWARRSTARGTRASTPCRPICRAGCAS